VRGNAGQEEGVATNRTFSWSGARRSKGW